MHSEYVKKQLSILSLLLFLSLLCNTGYADHNLFKEGSSKVSTLSVNAGGESIVTISPCTPSAPCIEKNRYHPGSGFSIKVLTQSPGLASIEKSFFTLYNKQFIFSFQHTVRLHLVFCVLLI